MRRIGRRIIGLLIALVLLLQLVMIPEEKVYAQEMLDISGSAHVQSLGDVDGIFEDGVLVLGTRGQGKRVESIIINFENNTEFEGTLQYRVHRQTYGWTEWVDAGTPAGTTGEGKRLEAIEIRLTDELQYFYDVQYSVHIQKYGDNQGWVSNGTLAGTTGESKRLEEVRVKITRKEGGAVPSVSYRVHRQTYGWESIWAKDGETSGTVGESKRLEGITIALQNNSYSGNIKYRTHVQSYGWLDYSRNGGMSGTQGEAKRLEGIEIYLEGDISRYYDVYYRVHCQTYGWLPWVKNGELAGTQGESKRLEAIEIRLIRKNDYAPDEVVQLYSYRCKYCNTVHKDKYELVAHLATYYEQDDVHLIKGALTVNDFVFGDEYAEYREDLFYNHYIKEGYTMEERECVTNVSKRDFKKHIVYKATCTYCKEEFVDSNTVLQHLYQFYLMDDIHRTANSAVDRNSYDPYSDDYRIYREEGKWVDYFAVDGYDICSSSWSGSSCHTCEYWWDTREEKDAHDEAVLAKLEEPDYNPFDWAHTLGFHSTGGSFDQYGYGTCAYTTNLTNAAEEDN